MVFHDWNGLTESRTFTDFYKWIHNNLEKRECPACGNEMKFRITLSFNMEKQGRLEAWCKNPKCQYYLKPIVIEAINRRVRK